VASRFAFHHFVDPLTVLKEMRRVCRPGGRIVVADSAPASDKAEAFNRMERLRDPSHARALPVEELQALFVAADLPAPRIRHDKLRYELDSFLARSFPKEGDADRVRQLFEESIGSDRLGVGAFREDGKILFWYPTVIATSRLQ
jgi:ubiquinone/menaquinone biosynthesis C-methylase UbiE